MAPPQCRLVIALCVLSASRALAAGICFSPDEMARAAPSSLFPTSEYLSHLQPSYPTAFTSSKTVTTSYADIGPLVAGNTYYGGSALTYTTIESWPAAPTSFPHEHLVTTVTSANVSAWQEYGERTTPRYSAWTFTSTATYHLWAPTARVEYKAPQQEDGMARCGSEDCLPADYKGHPTCDAEELNTGCLRQCEFRDGLFWCREYHASDWDDRIYGMRGNFIMGRVCWGKPNTTIQLLEPCLKDDLAPDCVDLHDEEGWWDGEPEKIW